MGQGRIGVLGGSGLYEIEGFEDREETVLETPFGAPSDAFVQGTLEGRDVVFLARHGRGHRINPSEINYRANIWGMRKLGVEFLVAISACGSLREEIAPGDFVVIDQHIDRTKTRDATFFEDGIVAHVVFADPITAGLAELLADAAEEAGTKVHRGGTYLCMEGPAFSTRAESNLYRSWGADVIGMTNLTEARLAREAEICYASLALVTDYDCWRHAAAEVSVAEIVAILKDNAVAARRTMREAVLGIDPGRPCSCRDAMRYAILTDRKAMPREAKERLAPIVGRYLS
jgi:5'-methylthioadenosine phosphorylase